MFKQVFPSSTGMVRIFLDDQAVEVPAGISVTAAMFFLEKTATRKIGSTHEPRGAFCLMGICYECLMEIDGVPNQQACLVTVRDGMRVKSQDGSPSFSSKETV